MNISHPDFKQASMNCSISLITKSYILELHWRDIPHPPGRDQPAGIMSVKKYYLSGKI
jgi:hypothetical protein